MNQAFQGKVRSLSECGCCSYRTIAWPLWPLLLGHAPLRGSYLLNRLRGESVYQRLLLLLHSCALPRTCTVGVGTSRNKGCVCLLPAAPDLTQGKTFAFLTQPHPPQHPLGIIHDSSLVR